MNTQKSRLVRSAYVLYLEKERSVEMLVSKTDLYVSYCNGELTYCKNKLISSSVFPIIGELA